MIHLMYMYTAFITQYFFFLLFSSLMCVIFSECLTDNLWFNNKHTSKFDIRSLNSQNINQIYRQVQIKQIKKCAKHRIIEHKELILLSALARMHKTMFNKKRTQQLPNWSLFLRCIWIMYFIQLTFSDVTFTFCESFVSLFDGIHYFNSITSDRNTFFASFFLPCTWLR